MKKQVVIIEDNAYKSFTTKQVLEAQLRLNVCLVDVESSQELARETLARSPDLVMVCPQGGVLQLLALLKKRKANRLNTEITVLVAQDFDPQAEPALRHFLQMQTQALASGSGANSRSLAAA